MLSSVTQKDGGRVMEIETSTQPNIFIKTIQKGLNRVCKINLTQSAYKRLANQALHEAVKYLGDKAYSKKWDYEKPACMNSHSAALGLSILSTPTMPLDRAEYITVKFADGYSYTIKDSRNKSRSK